MEVVPAASTIKEANDGRWVGCRGEAQGHGPAIRCVRILRQKSPTGQHKSYTWHACAPPCSHKVSHGCSDGSAHVLPPPVQSHTPECGSSPTCSKPPPPPSPHDCAPAARAGRGAAVAIWSECVPSGANRELNRPPLFAAPAWTWGGSGLGPGRELLDHDDRLDALLWGGGGNRQERGLEARWGSQE